MSKLWGAKDFSKQLSKVFKRYKVTFAYLFGSQAKGRSGPLSDIDIAVYFDENVSREDYFDLKSKLMGEFMDMFRRDDIDVVVLNEAPFVLENKILQEGKLIYSQNEQKRNAYETRAVMNYFDWDYLERKFTKAILGG